MPSSPGIGDSTMRLTGSASWFSPLEQDTALAFKWALSPLDSAAEPRRRLCEPLSASFAPVLPSGRRTGPSRGADGGGPGEHAPLRGKSHPAGVSTGADR